MNKRLTLLTKIENNQFLNVEKVNISEQIEETIQNFQEISSTNIEYLQKEVVFAQMDPYLAEILCNNLISNAIKHNPLAVKSTGLGLAIVKRICDLYQFKIDYTFQSNQHIFKIKFK